MKCLTNACLGSNPAGGGLTPCTVTIDLDNTLPSEMVAYIFAWNGIKATEVGRTVPLTFQTYVNSGFTIYGVGNSQWMDIIPNITDEDWAEVWNNGEDAMIFYIVPTSPNYSITLTTI